MRAYLRNAVVFKLGNDVMNIRALGVCRSASSPSCVPRLHSLHRSDYAPYDNSDFLFTASRIHEVNFLTSSQIDKCLFSPNRLLFCSSTTHGNSSQHILNMQNMKVADDIEFAYLDSGVPLNKTDDYTTIVIIHGHTYHNGVFERMFTSAPAAGYRLMLPNRRLYPGSTPYTPEEAQAFDASHLPADNAAALLKQGEYLLLFVDKIIQELGLKSVVLSGWSLGTAFINAIVASIDNVDPEIKTRVTASVKTIIWWDPPATAHGIEDPPSGGWVPLYDETLKPEERGPAFGQWIAQYFPHVELEQKDCYKLVYKVDTPVKTATFTGMPFPQLLKMVDFSAGPAADNHIADRHFQPAHRILRTKALFDADTRKQWNDIPFVVLYGEEVPYNIVWAAWQLEAEAEKKALPIRFKTIPGGNHFAMHDLPELALSSIQVCL